MSIKMVSKNRSVEAYLTRTEENPLLKECNDKAYVMAEAYKCAVAPEYYIFKYCYSMNTNNGKQQLLPNYAYAIKLIRQLEMARVDGIKSDKLQKMLIEKSRQMTVSWLLVAYCTWGLLFVPNFSALLISRKEDLVDKRGDLKSLFAKARFIIDRLPIWLKPTPQDLLMNHMLIENKSLNSSMVGESANENAGRGGATSITIMDEAAYIPNSDTVYGAVVSATKHLLILNSTPNGKRNIFYKVKSKSATNGYKVVTLHWRLHPLRDDNWYRAQCEALNWDKVLIARELDISYQESQVGKVWEVVEPELIYDATIEQILEDLQHYPIYTGWDFGWQDPTACIFFYLKDGCFYVFDEYIMNKQDNAFHSQEYKKICAKWKLDHKRIVNYGDPAGKAVSQQTGRSHFKEYSTNGIHMLPGDNHIELGIAKIGALIKQKNIRVHKDCIQTKDAIIEATYPTDALGQARGEKYEHNEYSHPLDAIRYVVLTLDYRKHIKQEEEPEYSGLAQNYDQYEYDN